MTTEQLPLIPEQPPVVGNVENVLTSALPPDDVLVGEGPGHDLVESVRRWGVLEPLLVRAVGGHLDYADVLRFVSGRRRLKAVRRLELEARDLLDAGPQDTGDPVYRQRYADLRRWHRIPVRVISDPEGTDADGRTDALAVTANAVRKANPASEFLALTRLLERFRLAGLADRQAVTEAAKATGLAVATIKQRLKLRDLTGDLLHEFLDGHLGYAVALECAKLGPETQGLIADASEAGERLTLEKVRQIRKDQVRSFQATLFDALPPSELRKRGGGEPPALAVRAQELREQLRSTNLPICLEAAALIDEFIEADDDHRVDAENRSMSNG